MRAFLEEYGKAVTTVIFAIFIFAVSVPALFNLTNILYPRDSIQEVDMSVDDKVYNQPVLMVNSGLRIDLNDTDYNGKAAAGNEAELNRVTSNFVAQARAYERSYPVTVLADGTADPSTPSVKEEDRIDGNIEVFGVETVDTTKAGVYRIAYYVENSTGHSFLCNVSVVVS